MSGVARHHTLAEALALALLTSFVIVVVAVAAVLMEPVLTSVLGLDKALRAWAGRLSRLRF